MKINKRTITSLIGGAILAFIVEKIFSPVLETIYKYFLNFGTIFLDSFSDSVYKEISNGFAEQESLFVMYIVIFLIAFFCISVSIKLNELFSSSEQKYSDFKRSLNHNEQLILQNLEPISSFKEQSPEDLTASLHETLNEIHELQLEVEQLESSSQKDHQKNLRILKITSTFLIVFLLFLYGKQVFINSAITKILCNIEIVAPYISDAEYKQLKSTFHLIENHEDYDLLWNTFSNIADEYSLKLKK